MKKSYLSFLILTASLFLGLGGLKARAFTEEEKAWAKSMLQAYGYSPDMEGANQAYQDYLNGKFNDICEQYGLPKQNVGGDDGSIGWIDDGSGGAWGQDGDGTDGDGSGTAGNDGTGQSGDKNPGGELGGSGKKDESGGNPEGSSVRILSGSGQDDGRIHFNQTRYEEGVYSLSLEEIWADTSVYPPVVRSGEGGIDVPEEGLQYIDLVFRIKNESGEAMDVKNLLAITLNDYGEDYSEGNFWRETEHGTAFTEETVLAAGEEGIFHYGTPVPLSSERFVGRVSLNGAVYQLYFDTDTHPRNREILDLGRKLEAENFASVTCKEKTLAETGSGQKLSVTLTVKNFQDETESAGNFAGLLAIYDGKLYRGRAEDTAIDAGQAGDMVLTLDLPREATTEDMQSVVYFDGTWYLVP